MRGLLFFFMLQADKVFDLHGLLVLFVNYFLWIKYVYFLLSMLLLLLLLIIFTNFNFNFIVIVGNIIIVK